MTYWLSSDLSDNFAPVRNARAPIRECFCLGLRYLRSARPRRPAGQSWSAFAHHAETIRACDFPPIIDLRLRPLGAFFVIAFGSRRVVHGGVTRHRADAWVTELLREATPFGETHGS